MGALVSIQQKKYVSVFVILHTKHMQIFAYLCTPTLGSPEKTPKK